MAFKCTWGPFLLEEDMKNLFRLKDLTTKEINDLLDLAMNVKLESMIII